MPNQEVLPGLPSPRFDPRKEKLYSKYVDGAGHILHGPWLRAIAEHHYVGTCRHCGEGLIPQTPHKMPGRTDYQADCRDRKGCGWVCAIPGGRYLAGSTRLNERR